jgi:hypothetical protein
MCNMYRVHQKYVRINVSSMASGGLKKMISIDDKRLSCACQELTGNGKFFPFPAQTPPWYAFETPTPMPIAAPMTVNAINTDTMIRLRLLSLRRGLQDLIIFSRLCRCRSSSWEGHIVHSRTRPSANFSSSVRVRIAAVRDVVAEAEEGCRDGIVVV